MNTTVSDILDRVRTLLPMADELGGTGSTMLAVAIGQLIRFQVAAEDDAESADLLVQIANVLRPVPEGTPMWSWQVGQNDLLASMQRLSQRALQLVWEESERPETLPASVVSELQALADRATNLLEGGTIEAADRADLMSAADDLLSIAFLYEKVTPELLMEARTLRRRVWNGCTPIVRARLATWVGEQACARWLGLDPVASFLWAPPDVILPA